METITHAVFCTCMPHVDLKSFREWNKEGYNVVKGEKILRIYTHIFYTREDEDGMEVHIQEKHYKAGLFCRCQVERKKEV